MAVFIIINMIFIKATSVNVMLRVHVEITFVLKVIVVHNFKKLLIYFTINFERLTILFLKSFPDMYIIHLYFVLFSEGICINFDFHRKKDELDATG